MSSWIKVSPVTYVNLDQVLRVAAPVTRYDTSGSPIEYKLYFTLADTESSGDVSLLGSVTYPTAEAAFDAFEKAVGSLNLREG